MPRAKTKSRKKPKSKAKPRTGGSRVSQNTNVTVKNIIRGGLGSSGGGGGPIILTQPAPTATYGPMPVSVAMPPPGPGWGGHFAGGDGGPGPGVKREPTTASHHSEGTRHRSRHPPVPPVHRPPLHDQIPVYSDLDKSIKDEPLPRHPKGRMPAPMHHQEATPSQHASGHLGGQSPLKLPSNDPANDVRMDAESVIYVPPRPRSVIKIEDDDKKPKVEPKVKLEPKVEPKVEPKEEPGSGGVVPFMVKKYSGMSALSASPAAPPLLGAGSRVALAPGPSRFQSQSGLEMKRGYLPWPNDAPWPPTPKSNPFKHIVLTPPSYGSGTQHSGKGKQLQMLTSNDQSIKDKLKRGIVGSPSGSVRHYSHIQKLNYSSGSESAASSMSGSAASSRVGTSQAIVLVPKTLQAGAVPDPSSWKKYHHGSPRSRSRVGSSASSTSSSKDKMENRPENARK
jgi:hypothetical protein